RYEVHIALSAPSALGDYTLLIGGDQIGEQTARFFLEGERSRRDADNQVVAAMAILLFAAPRLAVARHQARLVLEIEQRREAFIDFEDDRAAVAAVTARGAAEGPIFFAQ